MAVTTLPALVTLAELTTHRTSNGGFTGSSVTTKKSAVLRFVRSSHVLGCPEFVIRDPSFSTKSGLKRPFGARLLMPQVSWSRSSSLEGKCFL